MELEYADKISGLPIFIKGVGHVRSPYLRELRPDGIGLQKYHLYLNILTWNKTSFLDFFLSGAGGDAPVWSRRILQSDKINIFDTVATVCGAYKMLQDAISFFMVENLEWDEGRSCFVTRDESNKEIGVVDRNNYEDVRGAILELNYIPSSSTKELTFDSEIARKLYEKAKSLEKKTRATRKKKKDSRLSLGNVISKLCVMSNTYNLLNIYDLTVYQLYDQFSQYSYIKNTDFSERVYSIHGGKKFDFQQWLDPINEK